MKKSISIDTFDLILVTALIGGFVTENWLPLIIFMVLGLIAYSDGYKT